MEKTQKSGEGVKTSAKLAEEAQDRRERVDRLESEYVFAYLAIPGLKFIDTGEVDVNIISTMCEMYIREYAFYYI